MLERQNTSNTSWLAITRLTSLCVCVGHKRSRSFDGYLHAIWRPPIFPISNGELRRPSGLLLPTEFAATVRNRAPPTLRRPLISSVFRIALSTILRHHRGNPSTTTTTTTTTTKNTTNHQPPIILPLLVSKCVVRQSKPQKKKKYAICYRPRDLLTSRNHSSNVCKMLEKNDERCR